MMTQIPKDPIEIEVGETHLQDIFQFMDIPFISTSCKIGDIRQGDTVIERKTWNDFTTSMESNHLTNQYMDMEQYPIKIVIISGKLEHFHEEKQDMIYGMIARLARQGITTINVKSDWDLAIMAIKILSKSKKLPTDHVIIKRSKNPAKDILDSAAPRITTTLRDELLAIYGSPLNIALTPIDELTQIKGCGPTLAKRIHDNFRANLTNDLIPLPKSLESNTEDIPHYKVITYVENWILNWPKKTKFDIVSDSEFLGIVQSLPPEDQE